MTAPTATISRHTPPPGLAFGEPDDRLQRGIQYAAAFRFHHRRFGILDHPLSRMMTAEGVAHDSDHGTFARHDFSQIQISNSRASRVTASRSRRAFSREFYPERRAF